MNRTYKVMPAAARIMRTAKHTAALGLLSACVLASPAHALESRSYVVTWFAAATHSEDGDCVGGLNPKLDEQYAKDLRAQGKSGAEVEALMKNYSEYDERGWDSTSVRALMNNRARVNGAVANAFAHPAAVPDPHLRSVTGGKAYGFNLDGRGAADKASFEDPQTHEKGIDNQMTRALGCIDPFRGTLENDGAFWLFMWMAEKDSTPAWLLKLSGEDLSHDGPVTITLTRALDVPKFNGDGSARADMTYREDPDPRIAHNTFKGEIKNNVVTITEPQGALHLARDQLTFPNFDLRNFHVRLTMTPEGDIGGLLGGYQPIEQIYFALGQGGLAAEGNYSPELPGIYYLLRNLADADPDPKTGQNWSISTTYHIKAVPAFIVPAKDALPAVARR